MRFDDILENYVGEFGSYQKKIYVLVCLPAIAAAAFTFLPVFILATPKYRCQLPGIDNDTYAVQSAYHQELINASIPYERNDVGKLELSKCYLYDFVNSSSQDISQHNANTSKVECDRWVYDKSMHISAVNQFNMVCEDEILASHFKMITFFGAILGAFINGIMSDLFGRKRVFLICLVMYAIFTIIQLVSPWYWLFLAMRFFQGASGTGVFMISFVMVMELVGPSYRMLAGMVIEFFWCAGLFLLVGLAYFIKTWTYLIISIIVPSLLFLSYIKIVPESPRWLISRGYFKRAEAVLLEMAKRSNIQLPERLLEQAAEDEKKAAKKQESGQVWKLFIHRTLLIRTLIVFFNRFSLNISYYGMGLNMDTLSGNLYLNFTISSLVETVGVLFTLLFINRIGRKPLYCGSMIFSAIGYLSTFFPMYFGSDDEQAWILVLAMVGKFGLSAAYAIIFIYASELFPTSLRNSAMGLSMCIEVIGGGLSPYILDMGSSLGERTGTAFPMIFFGSFLLVAGLLSLLLPETRNKPLPETVDEAVNFGHYDV